MQTDKKIQVLVKLTSGQILKFTTKNLIESETHISFLDKFGDKYTYHKDLVLATKEIRGFA